MKNSILFILSVFLLGTTSLFAEDFTIGAVGVSYTPATLQVHIGDRVTIQASFTHPTTQVSLETWNANGTADLAGGWGTQTSNFTIMITSLETIYFVCDNHIADGMKGQITVSPSTGVEESVNKIGFEIYPNPVRSSRLTYLAHDKSFTTGIITAYTINGELVLTPTAIYNSGKLEMDLPAGTYIYLVHSKENGELLSTGQIVLHPR